MQFEFVPFGRSAPEGSVACDGLVPGARVDLSHWSHNRTPAHLKKDTSVEIALEFAKERGAHDVEVVTNNHFDADGVLAVWSALSPQNALENRDVIVSAAECGDFDEWPKDDRGIWLEAAISNLAGNDSDRTSYARVLPLLDELVPSIALREDLWGGEYRSLLDAERLVKSGAIQIEREGRVALFVHAEKVGELPGPWLSRLRPKGTDRDLIAFAAGGGRYQYRYELPRWAWADTVERPRLLMPKRGPIRRALGREWIIKGRRGLTGITYTAEPVALAPRAVARTIAAVDVSS